MTQRPIAPDSVAVEYSNFQESSEWAAFLSSRRREPGEENGDILRVSGAEFYELREKDILVGDMYLATKKEIQKSFGSPPGHEFYNGGCNEWENTPVS